MNEEVGERNRNQKVVGKKQLVKQCQTMSSGNVLAVFYQKLPMVIKDTVFGRLLAYKTMVRHRAK